MMQSGSIERSTRLALASVMALGLAAACGGASEGPSIAGDGPGAPDPTTDAPPATTAATPTPTPTPSAPAPGALPECGAQRTVHLVAGIGGLAWFTLLWPAPAVITGFQSTYSFDDPAKAASVGTAAHPLYVRRTSATTTLWQGSGLHPQPTAFVAGINQTHSLTPITTRVGTTEVIAAGARAQKSLAPALPVLALYASQVPLPYGPAAGAPAATPAPDVPSAIAALKATATVSATLEAELVPDATKLATWYPADAPVVVKQLAERLLFTANLLRKGLVGTVVMPALNDDPHGAWLGAAPAAARADVLAGILDRFYAELAAANETACGHEGRPLSLADNTVLVVTGDTPKNAFNNAGWPDGTPANSNFVYVRANGFLVPGWFGAISPQGKTEFDPKTGALAPAGTAAASQTAALQGVLYAITRGDTNAVNDVATGAIDGLIAKP